MSITVIGKLVYNDESKYDVEMLNGILLINVFSGSVLFSTSNHIKSQIMDRDKILFQKRYHLPNPINMVFILTLLPVMI